MRRLSRFAAFTTLAVLTSAAAAYAQTDRASLTTAIAADETKAAGGATIAPSDVAQLKQLKASVDKTSFADLQSRVDQLVVLYDGEVTDRASAKAMTKALHDETTTLRAESSLAKRKKIADVLFNTAVGSLTLAAAGAVTSGWAYSQFSSATDPGTANGYFVIGKSGDLATIVGGSVGLASLVTTLVLQANLYSTPGTPDPGVDYPTKDTTDAQKLAYLDSSLKSYSAQYATAQKMRKLGSTAFIVGLSGLAASVAVAAVADNFYQQYNEAGLSSDAENLRTTVSVLQWVLLATGTAAAVGLGGAYYTYVVYPSPDEIQESIDNYQGERATINGQ